MDCLKINKTVKNKIIAQPFTATTIFCALFMKHGDRKEFMDSVLNRLNKSRSFKRLGGDGSFVIPKFFIDRIFIILRWFMWVSCK